MPGLPFFRLPMPLLLQDRVPRQPDVLFPRVQPEEGNQNQPLPLHPPQCGK